MSIQLNRIALNILVRLPEHVFERHLPSSPYVIGTELADQVVAYVREHELGYYPALDFFENNGGLDPELIEAASHTSWFVANLVREEIHRKLRPIFASLSFQSVQTVAFTMPTVRPAQLNAYNELVEHYTPDTIKVGLVVGVFQKRENDEALTRWARHTAYRWLKNSFEEFEVTSAMAV